MVVHNLASRATGQLQRFVAAVLVACALIVAAASPAAADIPNLRKYAGIVVDAKSGRVLYEEQADARRYPASIAKVMTLYILFEELNAGTIKLSTQMTVSRHAAAAVPTKLGLRSGAKISVENAIRALVTLSANDIARVIAEHISGTESQFAQRMTSTARALGMRSTTYKNASGLPDAGQITTVRDQAILGIAVYQHFPQYYDYFKTKSFTYNRRTYSNHNPLIGTNGVDGIKTGYINAAGSNLLTSARKDNRHIVVVAFGFNTASSRNSKVSQLVRTYLPKARAGGYLDVAQIPVPGMSGGSVQVAGGARPVVPMPIPSFRLQVETLEAPVVATIDGPVPQPSIARADSLLVPLPEQRPTNLVQNPAVQAATALAAPNAERERPLDVIGAWIDQTFQLGPTSGAPLGQGDALLVPPVGVGEGNQAVDLMPAGSIATASATPEAQAVQQPMVAALYETDDEETRAPAAVPEAAPQPIGWVVQIGAAPSENGAEGLLATATDKLDGLSAFQSYVERFIKNGQTFYRARFSGFAGREAATSWCEKLKRASMSCLAVQG